VFDKKVLAELADTQAVRKHRISQRLLRDSRFRRLYSRMKLRLEAEQTDATQLMLARLFIDSW
jgi:hypothetical protein